DIFFMRHAWELSELPNELIALRDGQQAMEYLSGKGIYANRKKYPLPALLLLDLNLPRKGGFDVLRWIRQHRELATLKIVVVSGSNQDSDIALARSLGITDYIVKPSTPSKLLEIIQKQKPLWFPSD